MGKEYCLVTLSDDGLLPLRNLLGCRSERLLPLPLEQYEPFVYKEEAALICAHAPDFSFVVHGNLRNARYFSSWMVENGLTETFSKAVHLVTEKAAAELLENAGIPAIMPREHASAIDLLEFMLRISREGHTLYPCPETAAEEMPGLLQELQMEVTEFTVCRERELEREQLTAMREELDQHQVGAVLFHNRASVNRTEIAFPELDLNRVLRISGSAGVTAALTKRGLEPHKQADGSWKEICSYVSGWMDTQ
ncbi:MAG: uroporphyrinogen-III synthase [Balneolaceae bacterium]